jgi:hypothetical protein
MASKHRRRTHKRRRSKRGGAEKSVMDKIGQGFTGLKEGAHNLGTGLQVGVGNINKELVDKNKEFQDAYQRSSQGGDSYTPSTPPQLVQPQSQLQHYQNPMKPGEKLESKEKKGGLLGLGWLGLGGRRTEHTSFVNKMIRVKNSRKRNRAIRKYLTGGKKRKTRKGGRRKRKRKRKTKKRRRR